VNEILSSHEKNKCASTPRLVGLSQSGPRQYRVLRRITTIGCESGNAFVLNDATVSPRHAQIRRSWVSRTFRLRDLDSTNGTFLNAQRIKRAIKLTTGDEIRFGSGSARFVFIRGPERKRAAKILWSIGTLILLGVTLFLLNGMLHTQLAAARERESARVAELSKQLDIVQADLLREQALAAQPDWLKRVNYYRALGKLALVSEDPILSNGDFKHARYLAKFWLRNHQSPPGRKMHSEEQNDPWYTPEGFAAATLNWYTPASPAITKAGDVIPLFYGNLAGDSAIDEWISAPFHRGAILARYQRFLGYGQYCESGICAAALSAQGILIAEKQRTAVMFPPDKSTIRLASFQSEWPDPLASCPGYKAPTGLPITLQLTEGNFPKLFTFSVTRSAAPVETCGFDALTYTASDSAVQNYAREILKNEGLIVLVPKAPLVSGEEYIVSIKANDGVFNWRFSIE
jgi:pSer/pThr/pTyr-binding forkhead associated (FHA) protein